MNPMNIGGKAVNTLSRPGTPLRANRNRWKTWVLHHLLGWNCALAALCLAREVAAQDSTNLPAAAASPTSAQTQPAQPEAHPPEPAFGAGISELGRQTILEPRRRPRLFRVYSDTQYLYDSNVLLADGDFIQVGDDSVFVEDAGVSISAPLVQPLSSSVYYHHNLARYDEFSQFDFDADPGGLHLAYPIQDLFPLSADFSASRNYFRQGG